MVIVATIAVGVHAMSLSAPALAEQAAQSRKARAATEHTIAPRTPTATGDSMPVPFLVGGIVLAFAVGMTAGQLHRHRRTTVRRRTAAAPPLAAVAAPAPVRPAPPPPEPKVRPAPKPVDIAPTAVVAPAPPPPEARPAPPRVVQPPAAPAPPAPRPPKPEIVRPAAPAADGPEVPRAEQVPADLVDPTAPLAQAPEALSVDAARVEAPVPAEPVRRFARATPWPEDAESLWTCEIGWKAGYRKSHFRALATAPGSDKHEPVGDSPAVGWTLMADPEPPTPELAIRVRALMTALEQAGWEHIGRGPRWFAQRFVWRGDGEPPRVAVPELAGGEPPEA
jgi:hypothetical protein